MNVLAAAGALATITGHRRQAVWEVTGVEQRPPVLDDAPILDIAPKLQMPTEGEDMVADYASLGLTLGRHPVALLRRRLSAMRMVTAAQLREMPHGRLTRATGLVIGRQRPDTASGVIFVTLEDETGMINVVVWNRVAENQRRALLGSKLLAVHGVIEREGEVVHLVAGRLVDHSNLLGRLTTVLARFSLSDVVSRYSTAAADHGSITVFRRRLEDLIRRYIITGEPAFFKCAPRRVEVPLPMRSRCVPRSTRMITAPMNANTDSE